MTIRKFLAVTVTLCMLVSLTTAFASDTKTASGVLAGNSSVTAEEILARDFSKPVTISFAGVQVKDGLDYTSGNDYYKWWSDTFNVNYEITSLTFDVWVERMNTWINADDIPDWCVWNFSAGDAINYADQGLVARMDDDWREKYPNLAAASDWSPCNAYYEDLLGGMYFFFRPVMANNFPADTVTPHLSIYLRTDWAKQAGYDLSANLASNTITISEYLAYLQAVKDAGIVEYPWYNTSSYLGMAFDVLTEASGVVQSAYYLGADGKYHWGPAEQETGIKETLSRFKKAYDAGLIYPEFYTLKTGDDHAHYNASGDAAAFMGEGMAVYLDREDNEMQKNLGVSYWDVGATLVLTDDNGVSHNNASTNYWACNILSPNIEPDVRDRILSMWDYACTEEGQLRIRLGLPGVDWTLAADGSIVNLLADTEYKNADTKYTSTYPIYGNMFILSDDYSFINPSFSERARARVAELYKTRAAVTTARNEEVDWNLNSYHSQALNLATMTYADEYANLIAKDGDFDANYDQWVAEKMQVIQPVLDDLNAMFSK